MLFYRRIVIILLLMILLIACHSTPTNLIEPPTQNQKEKEKTKKRNCADVNIQLGMAYLERGNVQVAKQNFLLAMQKAPQYPPAWYAMAYYLEKTGDIQEADEYYLQALALAPKSGDTQNNYGTFLCRIGHYRESLPHFALATQDLHYLDTAGAYENAGLCAIQIPDRALATHYFQRALQQDARRPNSLIELANIAYQQKHYLVSRHYLQQFLIVSKPTTESVRLASSLENH